MLHSARRAIATRRINGQRIRLGRESRIYFSILGDNSYDPLEWMAVEALGTTAGTFVDIGANIGLLSIAMARRAGARGHVLAVEPQPRVLAYARENLTANSCDNVESFAGVFGESCGEVEFFISAETPLGISSSAVASSPAAERILVRSETLDSYFSASGRLDYLKIDAEGAEVSILRGGKRVLSRDHPITQVEVHGQYLGRFGHTLGDLFGLMQELGFSCINLVSGRRESLESFSVDTQYRVRDPVTGEDLGRQGYGQVVFVDARLLQQFEQRLSEFRTSGE